MSNVVSYELVGNIGVISVNSPPVNALSQAVREGILNAMNASAKDAVLQRIRHGQLWQARAVPRVYRRNAAR